MKQSAIYKIQSKINPERFYIGSATSICNRWSDHLTKLRKQKHENPIIQRHYNKYGMEDLVFSIIEPCLPQFLVIREQYYIDTLKPSLNICKVAGSHLGCKRSPETHLRMSIAQKKRKIKHSPEAIELNRQAHIGKPSWNKGIKATPEACLHQSIAHMGIVNLTKPILQFDINMNFIKEWISAAEVKRTLNICDANIYTVLKGKRKKAGGFIWKYKTVA